MFTRSDGEWSQQQKLAADEGNRGRFGDGVALSDSGETALIGASIGGSAYVFTNSGGEWTQQQTLTGEGSGFGIRVALSNERTALISAPGSTKNFTGAVVVFTSSDGEWSRQQKLTADDGDVEDAFGAGSVTVSDSGDTAIIGASGDEDPNGKFAGSAYVVIRSDGRWSQQQKLAATDGDEDDRFGLSTALSADGTTALIGAPLDEDPNGENAGSAYVFTSEGAVPGGGAGPSVRATGQQAGPPGGQASVTYELTTGGQESVTLAFTLPSILSLTPSASETSLGSLSFKTARQQVVFSPPDGELTPAVVPTVTIGFDIAADLSPPTTVEIDTAVLDETGTTTDRVTTTLEITADSSDSPLGGTAGEYDTSGDGTITARELGAAVTDFGQGELNARELGEVVTAFGQS